MSAAVNNLCDGKEFTRAYEGLLRHYKLRGQKAQAGQANENGDVEQRHYRFKQAVDQALMLRGSRDFPSVAAYQLFLKMGFRGPLGPIGQHQEAHKTARSETSARTRGKIIYLPKRSSDDSCSA